MPGKIAALSPQAPPSSPATAPGPAQASLGYRAQEPQQPVRLARQAWHHPRVTQGSAMAAPEASGLAAPARQRLPLLPSCAAR